jgi:serine protease inhibitor
MNQTLSAMGMPTAFKDPRFPDGADFGGICESKDPKHKLYISMVMHKAFVDVSEEGTEAAAATAVVMAVRKSIAMSRPFIPHFRADRPFIYLIRDNQTGSILFLGRMMNPKA